MLVAVGALSSVCHHFVAHLLGPLLFSLLPILPKGARCCRDLFKHCPSSTVPVSLPIEIRDQMALPPEEAGTSLLAFKVKLLHEQRDITVMVSSSDSCQAIVQQIRNSNGWDASKHVRLICSGKELYPEDPVSRASANVLHCIATDGAAPSFSAASRKVVQYATNVDQPPLDWLDVVDPGTVLMWIFGSILALLWLLFIFYASMFDKTSMVMLCIMTVAFLIPCVLSYLPWLPSVAGAPRAASHMLSGFPNPGIGYAVGSGAYGMQPWPGNVRQPQQQWGGQGYGASIPPRPVAQRRPVPVDQ